MSRSSGWARLASFLTLMSVGCGGSGAKKTDGGAQGGDGGCNGTAESCAHVPYGFCLVRNAPGVCIDWSTVGATPCTSGPAGCPPRPASSLGGTVLTICVAADGSVQTLASDAGTNPQNPSYCAAIETSFTPGGTSACNPNPCLGGGFCSWLINGLGELVTSCIRPL